MTWYRKYRPRTIGGLHLTKVRDLLQRMMGEGKLPQVMLFTGPKGTGKTSTARIIGALLNDPINKEAVEQLFFGKPGKKKLVLQEPSSQAEWLEKIYSGTSYLVQELDAASNRGIDDVRQLRERVHLPPQEGVMSVYILDEAHMLTTEAFNALLKLLEEPPPHTVFILATTERHKIPETVLSRCTVIAFSKANIDELSQALVTVLSSEKLTFEEEAVRLVAEAADGSFRDGIKVLEMAASLGKKITVELVKAQLQGSTEQRLTELVQAVIAKDAAAVARIFEQARQDQLNPEFFYRQLCSYLHQALLQSLAVVPGKTQFNQATLIFLLQELQTVTMSNPVAIPFLPLELKLLELVFRAQQKSIKASGASTPPKVDPVPPPEPTQPEPDTKPDSVSNSATISAKLDTVSVLPKMADIVGQTVVSDNLQELSPGDSHKLLAHWDKFVELVTAKNSSVAALLRSAKPLSSDKGKVIVAVFYKFHQEQLQQPKFRQMIDECIIPMTGGKVMLEFVLTEPPSETPQASLTALAKELLV